MQRPVLNPSFLDDPDFDQPRPRRRLWQVIGSAMRVVGRVLMWHPFGGRPARRQESDDCATSVFRVLRTVLQRLAFAPIVLTLIVAAMIYRGTHPQPFDAGGTPANFGIYYEPVAMVAADGQRLEGWLVPAIDAQMIVAQKDAVLRAQRAAVVLVHDQDATRAQMLPLVKPLHQAGLVVLVVGVRGDGTGFGAARTFGLRETMDVHAAVQMLRRRPFVDATRIAVVGSGSGATAALLAAGEDPAINALVLDSPFNHPEQVLTRIGPKHEWLAWLRPMCKWAFEFSHAVDVDDLNFSRHQRVLDGMPVLQLGSSPYAAHGWTPQVIDQMVAFLHQNMGRRSSIAAAGG